MKLLVACTGAFLTAASTAAVAHGYDVGPISIGHPWTKPTAPGDTTAAGYMIITNNGDADETLLSVRSPVAASAVLHEAGEADGEASAAPVEGGFVIPAGETVQLAPGSRHLTFEGLSEPFAVGDMKTLTLVFEKAGPAVIEMEVERVGAVQSTEHGQGNGS